MNPPIECIALLLQGGGPLGAYRAGVYEAMAEIDLHPTWLVAVHWIFNREPQIDTPPTSIRYFHFLTAIALA